MAAGTRNAKPKAKRGSCLNPKQARFVEEYLVDLNGKQAAIRAGYAPGSAEVAASRLLTVDKVRAEVETRKKARTQKLDLTVERVLGGLLREAELYDEGASHSARVGAWTQLGKHLGILGDKLEVKAKVEAKIEANVTLTSAEVYDRLIKGA